MAALLGGFRLRSKSMLRIFNFLFLYFILLGSFILCESIKDSRTGIMYFLNADRREISAIDGNDKVIWKVKPYQDNQIPFYRINNPKIVYFSFPTEDKWISQKSFGSKDDFIVITFESSQFGLITKKDGKFIFLGQD